jgi:hypothetical protein
MILYYYSIKQKEQIMHTMPKIDLSNCNLTNDELELCKGILNSKTGELRASKPPVPRQYQSEEVDSIGLHTWRYRTLVDANKGRTAYIWRMVAFMVSPIGQHHCMPVMADMDVPGNYDEHREETKRLDKIVDKIVDSIPANQWHGVARWSGLIG